MKTTLPRFQSSIIPAPRSLSQPAPVKAAADVPGYNTNATPPPETVNSGMGNYHEALRVSKDRSGIPFASIHMRPQILRLLNGLNRKMLSGVARYLVDNGGVGSYVVNQIADYTVPVFPRSQCDDPEVRKLYDDYFKSWSDVADFTRRHTFEQLQRLACIAMDVDGDIGASMEDGGLGFPQLRLWDTFHIGKITGLDPMDGVVCDQNNGVLKGYNVCDGLVDTITGAALRFIPSSQFYLLYDVERFNNYRGFSPFRRGSNDLRDMADLKAFLKLKEKIGAALAGVIQQKGMIEEDVWGNDSDVPPTGNKPDATTASASDKKLSLAELLGGDIPVIEGELKQFVAPALSATSIEFMEMLDGQFVLGLGIPPAFFLDEKLTGPNIRNVMGKTNRKFNNRKAAVARFVRWCWMRVIAHGIANDGLPAAKGWQKVSYQYQPLNTIDLGDTMSNERADVLCGQMSESERCGNRGKDFDHQHAEIVTEIKTKLKSAKELVTDFSSDEDEQRIVLPSILSRLGLVGTVSTKMSVDEAKQEAAAGKGGDNDEGGDNKKGEKK